MISGLQCLEARAKQGQENEDEHSRVTQVFQFQRTVPASHIHTLAFNSNAQACTHEVASVTPGLSTGLFLQSLLAGGFVEGLYDTTPDINMHN